MTSMTVCTISFGNGHSLVSIENHMLPSRLMKKEDKFIWFEDVKCFLSNKEPRFMYLHRREMLLDQGELKFEKLCEQDTSKRKGSLVCDIVL